MSPHNNLNLLEQFKLGFNQTIGWNNYQLKVSTEAQNQYLDYLIIDRSFQGVNRLAVFSFENETDRVVHTGYYLPKVQTKDNKFMIDVRSVFDQFIKNYICIKHIITLEKLVLVKQIITQLIAYLILNIPKETKSWLPYI